MKATLKKSADTLFVALLLAGLYILKLPLLLLLLSFNGLYALQQKRARKAGKTGPRPPAKQPGSRPERKACSPVRVNLIVGDAPPPGAVVFMPDGSVRQTPDTPETRDRWIVQKMTHKIAREPDDMEWVGEQAYALMRLEMWAEAIPDLTRLIERFGGWRNYYLRRAYCHLQTGALDAARTDLLAFEGCEYGMPLKDGEERMLTGLKAAGL